MKTKITNGSNERLALRHAGGIATIEPGDVRELTGLALADATKKRLEKSGWVFETDEPVKPKGKGKTKHADAAPESAADEAGEVAG